MLMVADMSLFETMLAQQTEGQCVSACCLSVQGISIEALAG